MTAKIVLDLALDFYDVGGDCVYECYTEKDVRDEIEKGRDTIEKWLELFAFFHSVRNERWI